LIEAKPLISFIPVIGDSLRLVLLEAKQTVEIQAVIFAGKINCRWLKEIEVK